jgi:carbon-monoxide dehydrogenase medium subunit/6-hydroxypseudooxynicotine dehydrogenase subunit alpha
VKLPRFQFTRARSLEHAVDLLAELGSDAKILAGGQSLIPLMSFRMAAPAHLVDVSELHELSFVASSPAGLEIGGTTRHATLEGESRSLGPQWQAFREAVPLIGHLPIRARGTIGGSIAHADATAELPLLARTFDAVIVAQSRDGRREIEASEFFKGTMTTDLRPGEVIVAVRFPAPPAGARSAFIEFSERAGDFALASVCAAAAWDDAGVCTWARVGLGAVGPNPLRSSAAEEALIGRRLERSSIDSAVAAGLGDTRPRAGLHVSAQYRRELVATMLRRGLERLAVAPRTQALL